MTKSIELYQLYQLFESMQKTSIIQEDVACVDHLIKLRNGSSSHKECDSYKSYLETRCTFLYSYYINLGEKCRNYKPIEYNYYNLGQNIMEKYTPFIGNIEE